MVSIKISFVLATLLGTALGQIRGPRPIGRPGGFGGLGAPGGRPRGQGPQIELEPAELTCEAEETFPCSSRRVENGIMACRSADDENGDLLFEKSVCLDPLNATTLDDCGCCGETCVLTCPCECEGGAGYLTEPVRKRPLQEGEEGMPDDIFKVVVCAEKLKAVTAVNMGRAKCLEECVL